MRSADGSRGVSRRHSNRRSGGSSKHLFHGFLRPSHAKVVDSDRASRSDKGHGVKGIFQGRLRSAPYHHPIRLASHGFTSAAIHFIANVSRRASRYGGRNRSSPSRGQITRHTKVLVRICRVRVVDHRYGVSIKRCVFRRLLYLFCVLQ